MASELPFVKGNLRALIRWLISGRIFKLYAPQAPPASPGDRKRLAISDLIPNLGDKVMMFPLLDAIRKENPDLEISYFTQGAGRLIGNHPAVDHLHVIENGIRKSRLIRIPILTKLVVWWWRHWRKHRFHMVVVLRGGVDPFHSHHLAWLLGGNARFAYSTALEPERPEYQYDVSPLFTAEVTEIQGVHEVSRGGEVLQLAGLLKSPVAIEEPVRSMMAIAHSPAAQNYLKELGLPAKPYAVVALDASMKRRAWPTEAFARVACEELLSRGWLTILVGGPELSPRVREFCDTMGENALDLTGKTNFEQLVSVCGAAQCFLGNDSGPAHVAGACAVPTVIVTAFARSGRRSHHASPDRSHPVGPWVSVVQPDHQLLPCTTECVASEAHCIVQVTTEEVRVALRNLLAKSVLATVPGANAALRTHI
jgi:ADP-heptose:LPS heptosyltransferase